MTADSIFTAAGALTRHCSIRGKLLAAIEDNLAGHPRSQSYDDTERPSAAPWCWEHERPVTGCWQAELLCQGETLRHPDPTGEAAVATDKARNDRAELKRLERLIIDTADRIARISDGYLPEHLPTGAERAKLATNGDPNCWFCDQGGTWSPPHTKAPTTVGGNLKIARLVCSGHYDLIRKHLGRAPSRDENVAYVKRGKYPRKVA